MALQHQKTALIDYKPSARLGNVIQFKALQQAITPSLAQFHVHAVQGVISPGSTEG
jgi:hypothetical protein